MPAYLKELVKRTVYVRKNLVDSKTLESGDIRIVSNEDAYLLVKEQNNAWECIKCVYINEFSLNPSKDIILQEEDGLFYPSCAVVQTESKKTIPSFDIGTLKGKINSELAKKIFTFRVGSDFEEDKNNPSKSLIKNKDFYTRNRYYDYKNNQ